MPLTFYTADIRDKEAISDQLHLDKKNLVEFLFIRKPVQCDK
jgi:hypothetical protein